MIISVVLMVVDYRQHHLAQVRLGLSLLVTPIEYLVSLPVGVYHWLDARVGSYSDLVTENLQLKAEQVALRAQLLKLDAIETENERLHNLLQSSARISDQVLVAELLAVDSDPYRHQVVLNKGKLDGVYVGQPVLDAYGIMGQVVHVGASTSHVLLLTDLTHLLPVQVNRNGVRALASGSGRLNLLELIYVPDTADIKQGDVLSSSGLGLRFPRGYPVAEVIDVQHDPGEPFARVQARPLAQLQRSRQVLLVLPNAPQPQPLQLEQPTAEQEVAE